MLKPLVVVATLAFAAPAYAGQIGNFSTKDEKDPVTDAETFIASTVNVEQQMLAIRCLSGDENLFMIVASQAKEGDPVKVLLRVDQASPIELAGQVLVAKDGFAGFQFGDGTAIKQIAGAKQLAARITVNQVFTTITFPLRESARVVDAVEQACKTR